MKEMGLGTSLFVCVFYFIVGPMLAHYAVDYWVSYFQHTAFVLPWLPSIILAWLFGSVTTPLAILTWVLSFIL